MFERPSQESNSAEREPTHEELQVGNMLQVKLMQEYLMECGISPDEGGDVLDKWVRSYAAKFADIYKGLLKEHPNLVQDWYEMPDKTSEELLETVKPMLYPDTVERHAA
jgi:hypothetical protein